MSPYLPLNLKWRLTTKEGRCQWKSGLYRIYINIFGIFLKIPILPMSFSWKYKTFDFYYKGDDIFIYLKKGKIRYYSITSNGVFDSLKEIDKSWKEYYDYCEKHPVKYD